MNALRDFGWGVRLYWRGFANWRRDPGAMAIGLLPGFITAVAMVAIVLAIGFNLDTIAHAIAGLVVDDGPSREFLAFGIAVAIIVGAGLFVIYSFVTITTIIGQPFFEVVSHRIDSAQGPVPEGPEWPWWRNAARGVGEAIRLGFVTVPLSIALFLIGLIPVVGTVAAWVLGALFGGWFMALEFTAIPFERRGMTLGPRRRTLAGRRPLVIGFGAMAYLMAAFAPIAVMMLPTSVSGGTLLARHVLDGTHPRDTARRRQPRAKAKAEPPILSP